LKQRRDIIFDRLVTVFYAMQALTYEDLVSPQSGRLIVKKIIDGIPGAFL
jgi:hypothetical protein